MAKYGKNARYDVEDEYDDEQEYARQRRREKSNKRKSSHMMYDADSEYAELYDGAQPQVDHEEFLNDFLRDDEQPVMPADVEKSITDAIEQDARDAQEFAEETGLSVESVLVLKDLLTQQYAVQDIDQDAFYRQNLVDHANLAFDNLDYGITADQKLANDRLMDMLDEKAVFAQELSSDELVRRENIFVVRSVVAQQKSQGMRFAPETLDALEQVQRDNADLVDSGHLLTDPVRDSLGAYYAHEAKNAMHMSHMNLQLVTNFEAIADASTDIGRYAMTQYAISQTEAYSSGGGQLTILAMEHVSQYRDFVDKKSPLSEKIKNYNVYKNEQLFAQPTKQVNTPELEY